MAEGARLESVFTRKGNVGSNPTLSAIFFNNLQALQSLCHHLLSSLYRTQFSWALSSIESQRHDF